MELRQLELTDLRRIYDVKMRRDFPESELRPYPSMEQLWEQNNYFGLTCLENEKEAAYACFVQDKERLLLDYYAVEPELRGQGVGGRFFTRMREEFARQEIPYVLLEVESVRSAKTPEETQVRERRIRFYEHCGCHMTAVLSTAFDVEYSIMLFPVDGSLPSDETVAAEMSTLYRLMFLPLVQYDEEAFHRISNIAL